MKIFSSLNELESLDVEINCSSNMDMIHKSMLESFDQFRLF